MKKTDYVILNAENVEILEQAFNYTDGYFNFQSEEGYRFLVNNSLYFEMDSRNFGFYKAGHFIFFKVDSLNLENILLKK